MHRLEDAGYAVGARVLELLCHREKVDTCLIAWLCNGHYKNTVAISMLHFCK